ncbi:hypothetical protein MEX01_24860 [Methylorubrum extorquens]|nr:hypothetical protein MEX01_24860 [Methylorubrum extorquens]
MAEDVLRRLLARDEAGPADLSSVSPEQLSEVVRGSGRGVEGADLFVALASHPDVGKAAPAAAEIVRAAGDVIAMAGIAAWLGRGGRVHPEAASALGRAFLERAGDRAYDYGARAQALKAAMILAQSDRALLRRLQAEMIELDPADDGDFLRHAANVTGALLAREPDPDLHAVLGKLLDVEEAEDEVAMELGLDALRTGLDATTEEGALRSFRDASDWFGRSEATSEERPDAVLYRRCTEMLVAFQTGRTQSDLRAGIDGIKEAAFAYTAHLSPSDRPEETSSWLGARGRERVHWSMLALRLGALDISLGRRAWLNAAAVIQDELVSVYSASRSIMVRGGNGGLEAVLRPRIVGALQRELHSLDTLDQWIEENSGSGLLPDVSGLRARVAEAREGVVAHRPTEAAPGSSPAAAILESIPEAGRASAMARVAGAMTTLVDESTSAVVSDLFDHILEAFGRNEHYSRYQDARSLFEVALWMTTLFVVQRSNVGSGTFRRVKYLFERDPAKLPLEEVLQEDYLDFLCGSPLAGILGAEASDVAGGRVDVLFKHMRTTFVAELKKTDRKLTNAQVVDEYGLQKVAYDVTNVSFGILMVLDLYDLGGGQPDVAERISVHHVTPPWGTTEHTVVLFRVQGRRKTPSKL